MKCSACGKNNVGDLHVVVSRAIALLETASRESIEQAILLLQQYFNPKGTPIGVVWEECESGWARANSKRIVICDSARTPDFQYAASTEVPDYAADYGVKHLTVVVLHEMGHVLRRRKALPTSVESASDDEEEIANQFARYILSQS